MSDIITIPLIEEPDQDNYFIEIDCDNVEYDDYEDNITPIKLIKECPNPPEEDIPDQDSNITVIHPTKKCHDHNVILNVKDLGCLVEAAKQDIGELLTSLATKKEVQDLTDRIPDDVASVQFVYSREHAIESLIGQEILNIKNSIGSIDITHLAKEATLIAKAAELKEALNTIDFTAIEQAIQGVEDVTAKEATLIQGVEDIIKAVENIDFIDLENSIAEVKDAVTNIDLSTVAKEGTLLETKSLIDGKFGDVFVKFGELITFVAQKFDWVANFIVTKKDELQQFISDRKLELHNLIAIDILGAINRNHGELQGKTNDILGNQQAYENNAAARAQDTINVVNSQGSQLGKHLDDNKWALMSKVDELRGENSEATLTKICGLLTDIKSGVDNIDTISDEQIDELFD